MIYPYNGILVVKKRGWGKGILPVKPTFALPVLNKIHFFSVLLERSENRMAEKQ